MITTPPRIAIVHDWIVSQRGGENVLDAICELFPDATLFSLIYDPNAQGIAPNILKLKKKQSFLNAWPLANKRYRHFLPFMPLAIENLDLSSYDLILSSSHCVAKGVIKNPNAYHLSYIHAPMRYMWDRFDDYFTGNKYDPLTKLAAHVVRPFLQKWDQKSATRVDHFLANSQFIADKIQKYYSRNASVVHPFCEFNFFNSPKKPITEYKDYYLIVSALVPYKKIEIAIEAFNRSQKTLLIVGDGPDFNRLSKIAGPTVHLLGTQSTEKIAQLYANARALIFPCVEDFGIVPLEAMASGCPVIALKQGGACETVTNETGVFFNTADAISLNTAVVEREKIIFDPQKCKNRAKAFTRARFQKKFLDQILQNAPVKISSSLKIADNVLPPLEESL